MSNLRGLIGPEFSLPKEFKQTLKIRSPLLLSVTGKFLGEHLIEQFVLCGIKEIDILVNHNFDSISMLYGDGRAWGVKLNIIRFEGQCTSLFKRYLSEDLKVVVLSPDHLFTKGLKQYLDNEINNLKGANFIVPPSNFNLNSFQQYFELSSLILKGSCDWMPLGVEISKHVYRAPKSFIDDGVEVEGPAYIGARSKIAKNVRLGPNAIVSEDVLIDKEAVVESSMISSKSYVGKRSHLKNVHTLGSVWVDLENEIIHEVEDDFVLSDSVIKKEQSHEIVGDDRFQKDIEKFWDDVKENSNRQRGQKC